MTGPDLSDRLITDTLAVLRSRLDESTIRQAIYLAAFLGYRDQTDVSRLPSLVRQRLVRGIDLLPTDYRDAARLMAGLTADTQAARISRTAILTKMAAVLGRKSRGATDSGIPLSKRSVETIERREIVPALLHQLRVTPRPAYSDMSVEVTLGPAESGGALSMTVSMTMRVSTPLWVVAVTTDELVAEHLRHLSPLVSELICPSQFDGLALSLSVHPENSQTVVRPSRLQLTRVSGDDIAGRADDPFLADFADVDWYLAELPQRDGDTLLTFVSTYVIDERDRYCYWNSTRRSFVNEVTLDYRHFPDRRRFQFYAQPFLENYGSVQGSDEVGVIRLSIQEWVSAGHGVALIWGDGPIETAH